MPLKPAQEIVLANLEERGAVELVRAEYEAISGVSRSQAAYDIAELVALGILERRGSGRATRYRVAPSGAGRPRKWTEDRIRSELESLRDELGHWPGSSDFRDAGRSDLYLAASRNGGIDRWASELAPEQGEPDPGSASARSKQWISYALVLAATLGSLTIAVPRHAIAPSDHSGNGVLPGLDEGRLEALTAKALLTDWAAHQPAKAVLRLEARSESTWVSIRRGSAQGTVLFEGLLLPGASVRAEGGTMWVRLRAPGALAARLNGRTLRLPGQPSTFLVSAKGVRVLEVEAPPPPPVQSVYASGSVSAGSFAQAVAAPPAEVSTASAPAPAPDPAPGAPGPDPVRRPR